MNKHAIFVCITANLWLFSVHADTLTSADLSCTTPTTLNSTTTIILDTDISITDECALIIAGPDFGTTQTDTVIFTSSTGNKLVIANGGTWNPSTFNLPTQQIQFTNGAVLAILSGGVLIVPGILQIVSAILALYQGSTIWLQNGTITIMNQGTIQSIASGQ